MGRRARATTGGTRALSVGDMALVVRRVKVLAVPAAGILSDWVLGNGTVGSLRGENDGLTDHLALGVRGNSDCVTSRAGLGTNEGVLVGGCPASVANVALGHLVVLGVGSGSSQHAETLQTVSNNSFPSQRKSHLLECGSFAAGDVVNIETTFVDELSLRSTVSGLWDADVGSVLVMEEHDSSPVVRLVLNEAARGAS